MSKNDSFQLEFTIITLGDTGVGKTSIFNRYAFNKFDENSLSTIGMTFVVKEVKIKKGEKIRLKLVDTSGQEKYRALSKNYYKNADGVLFVFALNDIDSFEHITGWIENFKENANKIDIPMFLVGNKNDLKNEVEENLINDLLEKNKDLQYVTTSIKDNKSINELFDQIVQILNKTNHKSGKQKNTKLEQNQQRENYCILCHPDN